MYCLPFLYYQLLTGARLGFYTPIKAAVCGNQKQTLGIKILSGGLSGGLAAAVTTPIELVKVRWCADYPLPPKAFAPFAPFGHFLNETKHEVLLHGAKMRCSFPDDLGPLY